MLYSTQVSYAWLAVENHSYPNDETCYPYTNLPNYTLLTAVYFTMV